MDYFQEVINVIFNCLGTTNKCGTKLEFNFKVDNLTKGKQIQSLQIICE